MLAREHTFQPGLGHAGLHERFWTDLDFTWKKQYIHRLLPGLLLSLLRVYRLSDYSFYGTHWSLYWSCLDFKNGPGQKLRTYNPGYLIAR